MSGAVDADVQSMINDTAERDNSAAANERFTTYTSSFPDTRRRTIKARHPPTQAAGPARLKIKIKYVNEQQMRAVVSPTMEQRCGSDENNERTSLLLLPWL